ncbi:MAG: hypothetical protein KDA84_23970 [Planctomycetaceae bacterium]|nr:hypothetical protein [Planctomycetaceae bacterium]
MHQRIISTQNHQNRRGVSTLDYVLVLGVVMPLAVIVVPTSIRIVRAAYEMVVVMIAWPFM